MEGKILYKGKELTVKNTFRALLEYENMTGKSAFDSSLVADYTAKIFYCTLKVCNRDFTDSFDQFLDELDNNPSMLKTYSEQQAQQKSGSLKKKAEGV
ncbi:MAG: hypothetical protein PUB21_00750 [Bacteroidales bacterium]|nr:hypothetical protein [Bacteroidales bacterium]